MKTIPVPSSPPSVSFNDYRRDAAIERLNQVVGAHFTGGNPGYHGWTMLRFTGGGRVPDWLRARIRGIRKLAVTKRPISEVRVTKLERGLARRIFESAAG